MDPKTLSVSQRVTLLVKALNGAQRTNEALAQCVDGEAMLDVLLSASAKLGLGLSREQLANTPPIRDWVWWKNKQALLTIGDDKPRYQQDGGQGRQRGPKPKPKLDGPVAASDQRPESGDSETPRRKFLGLF
jgi:hypothetical protein